MENTVLRLYCKDKCSCAVVNNPAYIPNHGDMVKIEDIYLSQPIVAPEKRIALIVYQVTKEKYTITYNPIRKETTIDIHVKYLTEISEETVKKKEVNNE